MYVEKLVNADPKNMTLKEVVELFNHNINVVRQAICSISCKSIVESHENLLSRVIVLDNSYIRGTDSLLLFYNGSIQVKDVDYVESSNESVTLNFEVDKSDKVIVVINKPRVFNSTDLEELKSKVDNLSEVIDSKIEELGLRRVVVGELPLEEVRDKGIIYLDYQGKHIWVYDDSNLDWLDFSRVVNQSGGSYPPAEDLPGSSSNQKYESVSKIISSSVSESYEINPSLASVHKIILNSSECKLSFPADSGIGQNEVKDIRLYLVQGTGSNKVAFPTNVRWSGGVPPTLSYEKGCTDVIQLSTIDQGSTWYGSYVDTWVI